MPTFCRKYIGTEQTARVLVARIVCSAFEDDSPARDEVLDHVATLPESTQSILYELIQLHERGSSADFQRAVAPGDDLNDSSVAPRAVLSSSSSSSAARAPTEEAATRGADDLRAQSARVRILTARVEELERMLHQRDVAANDAAQAHDERVGQLQREVTLLHKQVASVRAENVELMLSREIAQQQAAMAAPAAQHSSGLVTLLEGQLEDVTQRMRAADATWSRRVADAHAEVRLKHAQLLDMQQQLVEAAAHASDAAAERDALRHQVQHLNQLMEAQAVAASPRPVARTRSGAATPAPSPHAVSELQAEQQAHARTALQLQSITSIAQKQQALLHDTLRELKRLKASRPAALDDALSPPASGTLPASRDSTEALLLAALTMFGRDVAQRASAETLK